MGQKKVKQYQRSARKAAERVVVENIREIQNQLIGKMVNEKLWTRVKIAWRIVFKKAQVKNGK